MSAIPRFVRFTSPFWFAMQGYLDEADGTIIDYDETGRGVLVSTAESPADVKYVGVVHTGSVLPVARFDDQSGTVTVRVPAPWDEEQEGLPLVGGPLEPAGAQGDAPNVEAITRARAVEMFPGDFTIPTQDDIDRWADETWDDDQG